ncbi:MAG: hypothetical protein M1542_00245 [Thermotogae bacterium]|jgi:hypothetical protein|nr:hypothetical protein [Thermotogota bacterium]
MIFVDKRKKEIKKTADGTWKNQTGGGEHDAERWPPQQSEDQTPKGKCWSRRTKSSI